MVQELISVLQIDLQLVVASKVWHLFFKQIFSLQPKLPLFDLDQDFMVELCST